jgi:hypothetical protein
MAIQDTRRHFRRAVHCGRRRSDQRHAWRAVRYRQENRKGALGFNNRGPGADDRVPNGAAHADSGETLIRRYVEAGGRAAFLGASPLALVRDVTGAVTDIDYDLAGKTIGVHYPPRQRDWGYHVSAPTPEGVTWGLRNVDVAHDAIDPKDATVVLELDEFGMATSWAKSYGQKGGMVLQLNIPATVQTDLTPYRLAIEHGLN